MKKIDILVVMTCFRRIFNGEKRPKELILLLSIIGRTLEIFDPADINADNINLTNMGMFLNKSVRMILDNKYGEFITHIRTILEANNKFEYLIALKFDKC